MRGQCIDLSPDPVPLPRKRLAGQQWPLSSIFLLDVHACTFLPLTKPFRTMALKSDAKVLVTHPKFRRISRMGVTVGAFPLRQSVINVNADPLAVPP